MMSTQIEHILFLDIETVPVTYQYSQLSGPLRELWDKKWQHGKEITPEQQYARAGIYAEFAKIICIGVGFFNEGKFRLKAIAGDNEAEILKEFSALLNNYFSTRNHLLCAHNGKEFDYPFICRRLIINGLPLPKPMQMQGFKPWEVKHLDTLEMWKFGDIKNFTSLNLLAQVLGIPSPKDDIDGSMVARTYYEDKNPEKIKTYCLKDVVTVARVYQRFKGLSVLSDEDVIFA